MEGERGDKEGGGRKNEGGDKDGERREKDRGRGGTAEELKMERGVSKMEGEEG